MCERSARNVEAIEPAIKRAPAHPQLLGGGRLVTADLQQHPLDLFALRRGHSGSGSSPPPRRGRRWRLRWAGCRLRVDIALSISRSLRMRLSVRMHARSMTLRARACCPARVRAAAVARLRGDPVIGRFELSRRTRARTRGQVRDVLAAVAQRRRWSSSDAQPVEKIARNRPADDSARRSRLVAAIDEDVGASCLERADALHFAELDGTQQLGLKRRAAARQFRRGRACRRRRARRGRPWHRWPR